MGNLYIQEVNGEVIEFSYSHDENLHGDTVIASAIGVDEFEGYEVSTDYTNSHYFEQGGYSAY